jgi:hypothetical protein
MRLPGFLGSSRSRCCRGLGRIAVVSAEDRGQPVELLGWLIRPPLESFVARLEIG